MLLAMFCWVTLGPADHVHPFVETDDCDLFQEDNMPCHKLGSRMVWRAQQRVWSVHLASKFQDLNPVEHLWDVIDKQVQSTEAPPLTYHSTPSGV